MAIQKRNAPKRRKRRSYKEMFLDELKKQSKGEQRLIANGSVRDALDWNPALYKRIKSELYEEKAIIIGRGRGGTVGLGDAPGAKPPPALQVFISYSHQDEDLTKELLKHLAPLKRLNLIEAWHDGKIGPGDKWDDAISTAIQKADVVILFISIDFINSKYCYETEMDLALARQAEGEAVVIPVIARNCLWKRMRFAHLQALPTHGRAIASWPDRDEALTDVAEGIRDVAERLMAER